MNENSSILENPKFLRSCILYETLGNPKIDNPYEIYNQMCKKFNNDNFMDYPEFEFWFMRILAGNFDLDYDRSQDPKYRTITELPLELFEKVCEKLGDDYQNKYRFTLRHVCKSFRSLVDSWIPTLKRISIYSCTTGSISHLYITFDSKTFEYKNEHLALDDLTSILIHPKLKLNRIDTWKDERFAEKLVRKLESLKIKNIHVEKVFLNFSAQAAFTILSS